MSLTRTFEAFAPPPRYDNDPFTEALIEESAAREGTYALIETIELDPVDPDPAEPASRNFTTDSATLDPAWYRIVWKDASGDTATSGPIYAPLQPAWAPSVADVASLIRARTKARGSGGTELGTFTAKTRPTAASVERLITQAVRRVATAVGIEPCTDELREDARSAAALYTAMLIEQSYFPEQTTAAGSSFKSLEALWKDQIKTLTEAVGERCGGGDGEAVGGTGPLAQASFDNRRLIGPLGPEW